MKSLRPEYKEKSKVKFRIIGRERYPTKSYSNTASEYLTAKYLPSGSKENVGGTGTYYSVKDVQTDDVIIPYGTGSMVSCDSTGNYFNLWMNGLQAERYYKFEFKVVSGSNTVDETIQYLLGQTDISGSAYDGSLMARDPSNTILLFENPYTNVLREDPSTMIVYNTEVDGLRKDSGIDDIINREFEEL